METRGEEGTVAERTKKSTNTIRLKRMFDLVNEVQALDHVLTTYLVPLFEEIKERIQIPAVKKNELMQTLRQLALDEEIDPQFTAIQIDTDKGEIRYVVADESKKPEGPWPGKDVQAKQDGDQKSTAKKKPAAKKKPTAKKRAARSP